jgi:hypothetical protein
VEPLSSPLRKPFVRTAACLALSALAVGGCASAGNEAESGSTNVMGIALVSTPTPALERCRARKLVSPACPTLVPSSRWESRPDWSKERGDSPFPGAFELNAGAEHPGRPDQDRPPRFIHLLVLGGGEAAHPAFTWPSPDEAVPVRDGLRRLHRGRALALGKRSWSGHEGELVFAPPFDAGGIAGNHVLYRWREGDSYYAVTLHSWEPFTESVAVLRALVESIPGS